jgi:hypothetical protein
VRDKAGEAATLEAEACLLAKYMVGRAPSRDFIDRYREANGVLLGQPVCDRDAALVTFARRHPWSIPFLDAACGLLRPRSLLRMKILIMSAVLEASPEFADEFLPRDTGRAKLVFSLGVLGLAAVTRTVLGTLLYALAVRS